MNFLAYIPIPITITTGGGGGISALPPCSRDIMIATMVVGFVSLICLCLSMVFNFVFDREHVSDVFLKFAMILLTSSVFLLGIAMLCAFLGV